MPAVLIVQTSSSKFLKVLFQSHGGFHVPWASHHSLLSCVSGVCTVPTENKRKTRLPLHAHSRLASNLRAPSVVSERRRVPAARERGPGGGDSHQRRREVMSKQVIIMRCALQKLTRLSRRSVTHSSASRYSRESSSRTCSKSTARRRSPMGTRRLQGRVTRRLGPKAPAPGGLSTAVPSTLCSSQVGNRTLCYLQLYWGLPF